MTKVMLVEDDNNLREIYEARLQAEGYDIVAAKDGEEALVMAKEHKPELVISDVMMPKISGFEMLDILRNTDGLKDVKVIMLTALGQSDDQARADKLGADRYLVKSQVTLEDIVTVARELIDGDSAAAPAADPVAAVAAPVDTPAPVAVAPEPVAAPEPAATTPDPATPTTDPVTTDTSAQSTAQEEASVEAKIEDFVAGATSDPGEPAAAETEVVTPEPAVTPEPVVSPDPTPATAAQTAAATDDKLMADAVDTLMANTEANVKPSATVVTSEPAATPETPVIVPDKTPEVVAEKTAAELGSVPINGKKVISPVDSGEAEPSIEALLAKEEAKNIQAGDVVPPATPATPSTVVSPGGVDPNSIAL